MRSAKQQDIDDVRKQFEAWRAGGHARRAFPERLWRAAVELLERYPPSTICRRLRLNATRFKRARQAYGAWRGRAVAARGAFVELPPPPPVTSGRAALHGFVGGVACRVVLETKAGDRLSMELAQADYAWFATLCRLLLDADDGDTVARTAAGVVSARP